MEALRCATDCYVVLGYVQKPLYASMFVKLTNEAVFIVSRLFLTLW